MSGLFLLFLKQKIVKMYNALIMWWLFTLKRTWLIMNLEYYLWCI